MSSERADVHTSGHLDRANALGVLYAVERDGMDKNLALDALEACVVSDPRIADLLLLRENVDENGRGWIDADEFSRAMRLTSDTKTEQ